MNVPALQAFVEQQFGGSFDVKTEVVTVGAARQNLVDHNFERLYMLFAVLGSGNIFVSPDMLADVSHGIPLLGQGASLSLDARDDLVLPGFGFTAIATPAAVDLFILQVVRYVDVQPATTPGA